jgi:hypothetical protein
MKRLGAFALAVVAAGLLVAGLKLPLWQMMMTAPQYQDQDAIHVAFYPTGLRGQLQEIKTLNQYIGVTIPENLPQSRCLPWALSVSAGLALVAALLPGRWRRWGSGAVAVVVLAALLTAAGQAQWQMYQIGHNRDPHTILRGVKEFTPPLLGTVKIENFTVSARLGLGAYLVGAAIALQLGAAIGCRKCHNVAHQVPEGVPV